MPGPSHSTPDMTIKSSGSSSTKIKPETETEMPDYTKQYDFIKYWMFTSRLGPIAAPSTFNACFAAVTAEFGLDALTLEQVCVFHSDHLYFPKFLCSHSQARWRPIWTIKGWWFGKSQWNFSAWKLSWKTTLSILSLQRAEDYSQSSNSLQTWQVTYHLETGFMIGYSDHF